MIRLSFQRDYPGFSVGERSRLRARPEALKMFNAYCNTLGTDKDDLDEEVVVGRREGIQGKSA